MCRSQADGGQRCSAHTGPRYRTTRPTDPAFKDVVIEHASTRAGQDEVLGDAWAATARGNYALGVELHALAARGATMRAANTEAARQISQAVRQPA